MKSEETIIDLGNHQVPIVKGGIYDRFRSNPPLSVIAEEAPEIDLSWFKTLQKEKKDVGFETYSPNFYYKNSSITAVFTADADRLKELMLKEILEIVKPITVFPGRGLIAITAYAYHLCDNDSYNELSVSIITTKPESGNWGVFSLIGEQFAKSFWGYVLKLPVDTELARVRGVVGYNLPKWLIPIKYEDNKDSVKFEFFDESGELDFSMEGKKLEINSGEPEIVRSNFINLNRQGELTHGYTDVRAIEKASSRNKEDFKITLTDGASSEYLKALDLGKMVSYDYQPYFQAALYTPELITKQ